MTPLSASDAARIWQVLVDHAGADVRDGEDFVAIQSTHTIAEHQIRGWLGAGGTFRRNRVWIGDTRTESWTVDCYPEDLTPGRQAVIEKTNQALADLLAEARLIRGTPHG
jgi:hypothetical protein